MSIDMNVVLQKQQEFVSTTHVRWNKKMCKKHVPLNKRTIIQQK
jgi:hypothetical protein